jgi:hypothetical protein
MDVLHQPAEISMYAVTTGHTLPHVLNQMVLAMTPVTALSVSIPYCKILRGVY